MGRTYDSCPNAPAWRGGAGRRIEKSSQTRGARMGGAGGAHDKYFLPDQVQDRLRLREGRMRKIIPPTKP